MCPLKIFPRVCTTLCQDVKPPRAWVVVCSPSVSVCLSHVLFVFHTPLCVFSENVSPGLYTLCQDVTSSNVVYYFVCVSLTPLFCPSVCFSLYVILRKYFTCFLKSVFFQEVVPDIVVTVIDQMFHCCWFSFTCTMMHINLLKLG